MTAKWIALKHGSPENAGKVLIEWTLGNACNYSCSYCPASVKDGSIAAPSATQIVSACDRFLRHYRDGLGKKLVFQFNGGEPTLLPEFLSVLKALKERNCSVGLSTNASASYEWWLEADPLLDFVYLAYHVEHASIGAFKKILDLLSRTRLVHVNIAALPGRFDDCLAAFERLKQGADNVSIGLKPLYVDFGSQLYPYSAEQKEKIYRTYYYSRKTADSRFPRNFMWKVFDDGSEERIKSLQLAVSGQNRWKGWMCRIGLESLVIDAHGVVHRGRCRPEGARGIGTVGDENLRLPAEELACPSESCSSMNDILTSRYLPPETARS